MSVEFTLPTDTNAGSLYFQNLSEYFTADMKIFQLSEVNTVVAYNKSLSGAAEVSFSLSGFVNKKAFIEARYDPKTSEFSGELLVTTNSTLSIDELWVSSSTRKTFLRIVHMPQSQITQVLVRF